MIITENFKTGNLHTSGATLAAGANKIPHDGVWMNQYNPDGESWTHWYKRQMVNGQVITVADAQPMADETVAAYARLDLSEHLRSAQNAQPNPIEDVENATTVAQLRDAVLVLHGAIARPAK